MYLRLEDHVTLALAVLSSWCLSLGMASQCSYRERPHERGICGVRLTRLHNNVCTFVRERFPQWFEDRRKRSVGGVGSRSTTTRRARHLMLSREQQRLLMNALDLELGLELKNFLDDSEDADEGLWGGPGSSPAELTGRLGAGWGAGDREEFGDDINENWLTRLVNKRTTRELERYAGEEPRLGGKEDTKRKQATAGHSGNVAAASSGGGRRPGETTGGDHSGVVLHGRRKRNLVCDCCYSQCTIQTVALYC